MSDNNPTKDLVVHKGSDASIGTQPEEERMQRDRMIETPELIQSSIAKEV